MSYLILNKYLIFEFLLKTYETFHAKLSSTKNKRDMKEIFEKQFYFIFIKKKICETRSALPVRVEQLDIRITKQFECNLHQNFSNNIEKTKLNRYIIL